MKLDLTDAEIMDLVLLRHDKHHATDNRVPLPALEKALNFASRSTRLTLYRGLSTTRWQDQEYLSFTENPIVAVKFAKSYGTNTVLRLANGFGFPCWEWYSSLKLEEMNDTGISEHDRMGLANDVMSVEIEAEWIVRSSNLEVRSIDRSGVRVVDVRMREL